MNHLTDLSETWKIVRRVSFWLLWVQ